MHFNGEGKEMSAETAVTKSVNYPVSDGTTVVLDERIASILQSISCKSVRAIKRKAKRDLYVPDWISLEVNGIKKLTPLWQFVVQEEQLHRVLEGEGRIHHDGSNSFLPENFRRDAWPEIDVVVVETNEATAKVGQTPESVRMKQRAWLDDAVLYQTAIRQTKKLADGEVEDIVQASLLAALEQIDAGHCESQTQAALCSYFLATCRNKTYELDRQRRKQRKTHEMMTDDFAEGPLHHVRRIAPTAQLD
jgi:hypothetical protein